MKSLISTLALFCCLTANAATEKLEPTKSGLYDVGGFNLYLACYENDKPTLILEQGFGLGGSDGVWSKNIEQLQKHFSVCLYDRSGLGKSDKGPVPFNVNDTATQLNTLLKKAEVKPPYYFAGGSYAYYVIKAYNNLYPNQVSGAVLIDPPPFGYFYTMATRWPENFATENQELARYYQFEQSVRDPMFKRVPENVDHLKSHQLLSKANNFEDKPVIVLRAKLSEQRYDPDFVPAEIAQVMDDLYSNAEAQFNKLSSKSRIIYSKSEKHHLHIADPDLVVKSIKQLIEE